MRRWILFLFALILTAVPQTFAADPPFTPLGSLTERYLLDLSVSGHSPWQPSWLGTRTTGTQSWTTVSSDTATHPWQSRHIVTDPITLTQSITIHPVPVVFRSSWFPQYPRGGNDGPVWQGRGVNASIQLGGAATFDLQRYGVVTVTLLPVAWLAENRSFAYPQPDSAFSNPYGYITPNIDLPQRFGSGAITQISLGESEINYRYRWAYVAFSNQAMWLGPMERYPILMSNTAGGFPHLRVGVQPETRIGTFEFTTWFGRLSQSDFFLPDHPFPNRHFAGFAAYYQPVWIPGLTVGANRVLQSNTSVSGAELLAEMANLSFFSHRLGWNDIDQRASLTAQWRFPSVGFTVYGEWARNDWSPTIDAVIEYPQHSHAFAIGAKQSVPVGPNSYIVLHGEIIETVISRNYDLAGPVASGFYTHHNVRQGHTHRGQMLGPYVGPGADAQFFSVHWYKPQGSVGTFVERTSRDKDVVFGAPLSSELRDTFPLNAELALGVDASVWLGSRWMLFGEVGFATNVNWNYQKEDTLNAAFGSLGLQFSY